MIDWRSSFAVIAGGGIGAFLRYAVGAAFLQRFGPGFPYGTLTINLAGSFCIGVVAELAASRSGITPLVRTFLVAGVLGGFTTFSSFAYETVTLGEDGANAAALGYVLASVVGGVLAALGGIVAVRALP